MVTNSCFQNRSRIQGTRRVPVVPWVVDVGGATSLLLTNRTQSTLSHGRKACVAKIMSPDTMM